jgi:hypothetical protein
MSKTAELPQLRSYLRGGWALGSGPAQTLFNPATEEELTTLHGAGLEVSAALGYALRRMEDEWRRLEYRMLQATA